MAHPRMYDDSNPAIKRLREICLALPEVFEKEAWGECTFRVTGGSMFSSGDQSCPASEREVSGIERRDARGNLRLVHRGLRQGGFEGREKAAQRAQRVTASTSD